MADRSAPSESIVATLPVKERALLYRSVFEGVPIGLYATTPDGTILAANRALVEILGFTDPSDLLETQAADLYVDQTERSLERRILETEDVVRNYDVRLRHADGRIIWARDNCRAVRDEDHRILFYEGSLQDITAERLVEARLAFLARHDPLTGVLNRHALNEILKLEFSRSRRHGHYIAAILVDVDELKRVNDEHGHAAGDRLLKIVAGILQTSVRETDSVVRFGGDEFLIVMPETQDGEDVVRDRILKQIEETNQRLEAPFSISVSMGFSSWDPESSETVASFLARADRALYEDKARRSTASRKPHPPRKPTSH